MRAAEVRKRVLEFRRSLEGVFVQFRERRVGRVFNRVERRMRREGCLERLEVGITVIGQVVGHWLLHISGEGAELGRDGGGVFGQNVQVSGVNFFRGSEQFPQVFQGVVDAIEVQAAHGGNRTGRVFTGDGRGASGEFLFAAMKRAGFANKVTCDHAGDGLTLTGAYILAAARCAPPGNKPLPEEIRNCRIHFDRELDALRRVRVMVALGRIAWDAALLQLTRRGDPLDTRPVFGHGTTYRSPTGLILIGSYHPSRQNTHTGRLTARMLGDVFLAARDLIR